MEKELSIDVLTLQDIEDCANRVVLRLNNVESCTYNVRTRSRLFKEVLVCRYCYFRLARQVRNEGQTRKDESEALHEIDFMYSLQQVGRHIGFYHATVMNGLKSFDLLLEQKHPVSVQAWDIMWDEVYKLLLKKDKDAKIRKRFLIGGI
jgi:hypothetical protein